MKRRLVYSLPLLLAAALYSGSAQNPVSGLSSALDNGQTIYAKPYARPATGLDILRKSESLIIGQTALYFEGITWQNDRKFISTRNQENTLFTGLQRFNWLQKEWRPAASVSYNFTMDPVTNKVSLVEISQTNSSQKFAYKYNAAGDVIEELTTIRQGTSDTIPYRINFKRVVSYDQNRRRVFDSIWTTPDGSLDSLRVSSRNAYTYNAKGLVTEEITDFPNPQTNAWTNLQRVLLSYDAGDRLTGLVTERWNATSNAWEAPPQVNFIPKEEYSYTAEGRLAENIIYRRNNNGEIMPFTKTSYTYTPSGTLSELQEYDMMGSSWLNRSKFVFSAESNGKMLLGQGYSWADNTWDTIPGYRYIFQDEAVSVEENAALQSFVSPVPAHEFAFISLPQQMAASRASLVLINTLGELVYAKENISGERVMIERSGLPAGIYYYQVSGSGTSVSGKIVFE